MTVTGTVPVVEAALAEAEHALAAAGLEHPRVEAEWLLAGILEIGRGALALNARRPLVGVTAERYDAAVRRRVRREPLQRILGWEDFRGLRVRLTSDVLVPRPETELLVEWALGFLPPPMAARRCRALDVGTGSGCIACALAHERRDLEVTAIDVSPAAARMAQINARALGVDVHVVIADLVGAIADASVDLVVANLPYVPDGSLPELAPEVTEHEPRLALAAGPRGLDAIQRLIPEARRVLATGGTVVLETFGGRQANEVSAHLIDAGFDGVVTRADLAGVVRFVAGGRP